MKQFIEPMVFFGLFVVIITMVASCEGAVTHMYWDKIYSGVPLSCTDSNGNRFKITQYTTEGDYVVSNGQMYYFKACN